LPKPFFLDVSNEDKEQVVESITLNIRQKLVTNTNLKQGEKHAFEHGGWGKQPEW